MTASREAGEGAAPPLPEPLTRVADVAFRAGGPAETSRAVPEETPVALVYDGATQAVMMATPADLEDFAVGFSLTEGIVASPAELTSLEVLPTDLGVEVRMWLAKARGEALAARRRHFAGPTGCGLCGIDSLAEAVRPPRKVAAGLRLAPADIGAAQKALAPAQSLFRETRAVHAAGLWRPGAELVAAREDVGRHNALDKLVGAMARAGEEASGGVLVLTSRVSVEMVQKASVLGAPVLVAASAPTALAIRTAEEAGITLVAVAREDGFEVFTHPGRIGAGRVGPGEAAAVA